MFDLESFTQGVLYSLSRQGVDLREGDERECAERELVRFVESVAPGALTYEQRFPPKLGANVNPEVHETHCCAKHGCKYSYADCPVKDGTLAPRYSYNNGCEQCELDEEEEGDDDE